jgi:hypothetical protein
MKSDTLGELVKCKSSKNSFEPNSPENPSVSGFLVVFQKVKPGMSGPQPGHVRAPLFFHNPPDLSGSVVGF